MEGKCGVQKVTEETKEILKKYPKEKDQLIMILNDVQEKFGYIPKQAQMVISEELSIPMAEIYLGTACFVKGSQNLLDRAKERLKIEPGGVTPDGKFSLDDVRCVGACGLAPVFMVNDEVYGNATVKQFDEVIDKYMNE